MSDPLTDWHAVCFAMNASTRSCDSVAGLHRHDGRADMGLTWSGRNQRSDDGEKPSMPVDDLRRIHAVAAMTLLHLAT
jgi:hypothetical protein